MKRLKEILRLTQAQLFDRLKRRFSDSAICREGEFILVRGESPVLLVAHLDTVHAQSVQSVRKSKDGSVWTSPQGIGGDDRCGVYALLTVRERAGQKPWLLFTCDEETGCKGAFAFCDEIDNGALPPELKELKCVVEIDRRGKNEAVYYDCANKDFEDYITGKGFQTKRGSFSDISCIAPVLGIAAVNLSAGYSAAHTKKESVNIRHLNRTIDKVTEIVQEAAMQSFPIYKYINAIPYRDSFGIWDWYDYGDSDEDFTNIYSAISSLPGRIRGAYTELLDYYTADYLDEVRYSIGDNAILELYESEFGEPYIEERETDEYNIWW